MYFLNPIIFFMSHTDAQLFFTSFLAVLIIISQRNEIEFGVIFYDYNTIYLKKKQELIQDTVSV